MPIEIGHVESLFRYPVKSMAGEALQSADLGWHGIEGDRRFAVRRVDDRSGFPWLTAGKLAALVLYRPHRRDAVAEHPTHVLTPEGAEFPILSDELARDIEGRYGAPVQMMHCRHGVFDDASVSVIATATLKEIERLSGLAADVRRFRPNIVLNLHEALPFCEDRWVGGTLTIGDAAIAVTMRDLRCGMVNLDPDSARTAPEVLKAIVRANENNAGIYGTVTHASRIAVGDVVRFHPSIA